MNLCACCLRSLRTYPVNTVLCTKCKSTKDHIVSCDQFSLIRILETYRPDIIVTPSRNQIDLED